MADSEENSEKRQKFDPRTKYMLTPHIRQKRKAALAKLESLERGPTSNLDVLPNECILQIMHHLDIQNDIEAEKPFNSPSTSGLSCFRRSYSRFNELWEEHAHFVLVGMQEKQYPQYLEMFGRLGHETKEQIQNLRCAIASKWAQDWWRSENEGDPERFVVMRTHMENLRLCKPNVMFWLGTLNQTIEEDLRLCRMGGFGAVETQYSLSEHTVKKALVTLWRMGWKLPDSQGRWWQDTGFETRSDNDTNLHIFNSQSQEVHSCIRHLLLFAGDRLKRGLQLERDAQNWAYLYCSKKATTPEDMEELAEWVATMLSATLVKAVTTYGIGDALAITLGNEPDYDIGIFVLSSVENFYRMRPQIDKGFDSGLMFEELGGHVKLMKGLGAYDIFRPAQTNFLRRRSPSFEGEW